MITKVVVSYSRTHSLPDYNNVRPGVTLEAQIGPGDDYVSAMEDLTTEAQSFVEEQIDFARENDGLPALYSTEPRYSLFYVSDVDIYILVPAGVEVDKLPGTWVAVFSGHRAPMAVRLTNEMMERKGYPELLDWSEMTRENVQDAFWDWLCLRQVWGGGELRYRQASDKHNTMRAKIFQGPAFIFRDSGLLPNLYPSIEAALAHAEQCPYAKVVEVHEFETLRAHVEDLKRTSSRVANSIIPF